MATETFDLGGGKLYFAERNTDGSYQDFMYFGRTDEDLKLTLDIETLPHPNTEGSTEEVDFEIESKKTLGFALTTDDMTQVMVSRFFRGSVETTAQSSGSLTAQSFAVNPGGIYELGFIDFSAVTAVTGPAGTPTYTEGTDYAVDLGAGTIEILAGGAIATGNILVTGAYNAVSFDTVQVGTTTKLEGKFKFISEQTTGMRRKYTIHKTSVLPSGEFALKGTKDWKKCSFDVKILKDETITANGESKYMKIEEIV